MVRRNRGTCNGLRAVSVLAVPVRLPAAPGPGGDGPRERTARTGLVTGRFRACRVSSPAAGRRFAAGA